MIQANNECTGCMACRFICPKSAISMCEDKEGFLYPVIDEDLCIDCEKCDKVCPIGKTINSDSKFEKEYYAARVPKKKREASCNLYYAGGYAALKGKYFPQYAQVERRLNMMYTIKWIKRLLLGK